MKVSIITVVYNGEKYLVDCIESIIAQTYQNIEYIVIDGASTDGTLSILEKYKTTISKCVSEQDSGMYHALNKGVNLATGDIVGILNADDMLASPDVISNIVSQFQSRDAAAVYGNLNYIDQKNPHKIIRKWISKQFTLKDVRLGWMPAHPTLYIKRDLFDKYNNYSLNFGTAADYELMLRFLFKHQIKAIYLNELLVNMRIGGMSNASFKQRCAAIVNDYKAIKTNHINFPLLTLFLKKVSKITQYLHS